MSTDRVQTVRNAWVNRVRDEALRMHRPEICKIFHIGMVIATYADADGGNAFPSAKTIAAVAGCTEETVTRCVKVLVAVGLMERKRRPNQSAVYQLLLPLQRPDWLAHLHLYTDTRQAKAKKAAKAREIAEAVAALEAARSAEEAAPASPRNPSQNGIRNPSPSGVPEPVPAGGSGESGTRSRTGTDPVPERVPEPVPAGGYQYSPTSGRDPAPDHDVPGPVPQPPVRAGARGGNDQQPPTDTPWSRCADCGQPLVRPGKNLCSACARARDRPA